MTLRLHLASSSSRRREILRTLGLEFSFAGVDLDEARRVGEAARDMVVRLAVQKARAATTASDVVLAADTAVVLGDRVFGKPRSAENAAEMLAALSGHTHEVVTGVAVLRGGSISTALSRSKVRFRDIHPAQAAQYWQSGEPRDKAGGYAIQGLGGTFVSELRGSYSGVVGLPVYETAELLSAAGIDVLRSASSQ